jgi:predicted nucleic acid-binding protein
LGFDLRRKGLTVPLPDLLIAQAALTGAVELWHLDDHYEAIREHSALRTRSFLDGPAAGQG